MLQRRFALPARCDLPVIYDDWDGMFGSSYDGERGEIKQGVSLL